MTTKELNTDQSGTGTVTGIRFLTDSAFVLTFTRGTLQFRAGQHIIAGLHGDLDQREYSVYSGEKDDLMEILVKEVTNGNISLKLGKCRPGDKLQIDGPFGNFGIEPFDLHKRKHIFIATGTGISPFHSFIRSYPGIDYKLIHGVGYSIEAYESDQYDRERYVLCTSKEKSDGRKGRLTGYLSEMKTDSNMLFYLCGNGSMIYEAYHIIRNKGVPDDRIFTETYF